MSWTGVTLSGSSSIQLAVRDAAGNTAAAATQAYVLDTTAPATTVSAIALSADTGESATDLITQTAAQTITATLSGALAAGEALYGSLDNGASWTQISNMVSGTAVSWTGVTLSGSSSIQLAVRDAAGNTAAAATQAYVLDTVAPVSSMLGNVFGDALVLTITSNEVGQFQLYTVSPDATAGNPLAITNGIGSETLSGQGVAGYSELVVKVSDKAGNMDTLPQHVFNGSFNSSDNITGTSGDDFMLGAAGNDTLNGGNGADTLIGGAGDDTMTGGLGADTLTGGGGADVFVYNTRDESYFSGEGTPLDAIVAFQSGTDKIRFSLSGNAVDASNFVSVGNFVDGKDSPLAFSVADNALYVSATGTALNNTTAGAYVVSSLSTIAAGDLEFVITGTGDADVLKGGVGKDTITGGAGADTLTGGAGADHFKYGAVSEFGDTIMDFGTGSDVLNLSGAAVFGGFFVESGVTAGSDFSTKNVFIFSGAAGAAVDINTVATQIANDNSVNATGGLIILKEDTSGQVEVWYSADMQNNGSKTLVATLVGVDITTATFNLA